MYYQQRPSPMIWGMVSAFDRFTKTIRFIESLVSRIETLNIDNDVVSKNLSAIWDLNIAIKPISDTTDKPILHNANKKDKTRIFTLSHQCKLEQST